MIKLHPAMARTPEDDFTATTATIVAVVLAAVGGVFFFWNSPPPVPVASSPAVPTAPAAPSPPASSPNAPPVSPSPPVAGGPPESGGAATAPAPAPAPGQAGSPPAPSAPPAPVPKPSRVELREYKPEGFTYGGLLIATVVGKGYREDFRFIRGDTFFRYQVTLEWEGEVEQNDGETVVERRRFTRSGSTVEVALTEFGLTTVGQRSLLGLYAAIDPDPTGLAIAKVVLGGADHAKLLKTPGLGPWIKDELEPRAKAARQLAALGVLAKNFGRLQEHEVVVTWKDGLLYDCTLATGSVPLTGEERSLASRAAGFVDLNILPPGSRGVGERWSVPAQALADYFSPASGLADRFQGALAFRREDDLTPGRVAQVQLEAPADVSYRIDGKRVALRLGQFDAEVAYGPPPGPGAGDPAAAEGGEERPAGRRFVSRSDARGRVEYWSLEKGHPLFGVTVQGEPEFMLFYECRER